MSNNTTNSPINISPQSITGKCDLKCAYNFDYPTTNLVATNNGTNITIKFDNQNSTPVTFNNTKYIVVEMLIMSPSLHLFNGSQTPAELIIMHSPQTGGAYLSVCIPIVQSSNTTDATNLVTEIIQLVSPNSVGEPITLNISNFTLNDIVPKKPFYNFNSNTLGGNCIVYGKMFAIPLSQTTLTTLSSMLNPGNSNDTDTGDGNLFFNSTGPNQSSSGSDGIYISCSPTGNSEDTTDTTTNTNKNTSSSSSGFDITKYEYLLWILVLIGVVILLIAGINFVIKRNSRSAGLTESEVDSSTSKSFFSSITEKFKK